MNVLASECSSGCESGWTMYLEHSNFLGHSPNGSNRDGGFCNGFEEKRSKKVDEEDEEDEEDQSMVSDASSGPPHFNEDELYFDENNNPFNGCFYPPSKDVGADLKFGGKRQRRIKEKGRRSFGDQQQQQQQPSFLDDTASSPVFNFSKNNFIVSNNNQGSAGSVLDYSQGFSSTQFQGRSAYQDHFGFLQPTVPGNPFQNNQLSNVHFYLSFKNNPIIKNQTSYTESDYTLQCFHVFFRLFPLTCRWFEG